MQRDSAGAGAELTSAFASIKAGTLIGADEAILTGGGGGFTQRFTDFVIGTSGETLLSTYKVDLGTGEPTDLRTAPLLLHNRASEYARLLQIALDIDFFNLELEPPPSSLLRHTAVAHPNHGAHRVIWALDVEPVPPKELVIFDQGLRRFLTKGFEEEFGA